MASLLLNASEIDLLRCFINQGVRFLVVGGHAVIFHGYLRAAKDLDLFVDHTKDNPSKIISGLSLVGVSLPELSCGNLCKPNQQIRINGVFHTEILTSIAGVSFEVAFDARVYASVSDLQVPVMSLSHLFDAKRALARPQDMEDIAALQNIAAA